MKNDPLRLLALIPARAGSTRLPGKNTRSFGGRPLIEHTIECALECPALTRVIVSTDSKEVAEVSRKAGADVPWMRPDELASNTATSMSVAQHALKSCEEEEGEAYHGVVLLQPTSPLRQSRDVQTGVAVWLATAAKLVVSVSPTEFPASFLVQVAPDGGVAPWPVPEVAGGMPPAQSYRYNGAVYVFQSDVVREGQEVAAQDRRAFVMPSWRSGDIDTLEDFVKAEAMWAQRRVFDDR